MAGETPPGDGLQRLADELDSLWAQVRKLQSPTGTQTAGLYEQVQQAIANIGASVTAYLASGFSTAGSIIASGVIYSVGSYNLDVTALPGARRGAWIHNAGAFGYAPSTMASKANLAAVFITAEMIRKVQPYVFEYRAQIDIRDNPENPFYDPAYEVPLEIGYMAEHFIEAGLEIFVQYLDDGTTPASIDYAGFAAVAVMILDLDVREQMADLRAEIPNLVRDAVHEELKRRG